MSDTPLTNRLVELIEEDDSDYVPDAVTLEVDEYTLQALVAEQVALAVAKYKTLIVAIDRECRTQAEGRQNTYTALMTIELHLTNFERTQQAQQKPPQVGTMPCKTCGADRAKEPCKHRDISQCVMRGVAQQEQKGGDE